MSAADFISYAKTSKLPHCKVTMQVTTD